MLTIGQVASAAGLRTSAIRYYEALGLLPRARRKSGKRVYDASIMERLGLIGLAKFAGFDLEEILAVLSRAGAGEPAATWRKLGGAKRLELADQISRLARMNDVLARLDRCTCATLQECGRAFNAARGQEIRRASGRQKSRGTDEPRRPGRLAYRHSPHRR